MVSWLFKHGIMPLYTPLSGSWLNMGESVQRIIVGRALSGQYPQTTQQIIDWLEETVDGCFPWTQHPLSGTANAESAGSGHGSNV